jgi:hypothetical protein
VKLEMMEAIRQEQLGDDVQPDPQCMANFSSAFFNVAFEHLKCQTSKILQKKRGPKLFIDIFKVFSVGPFKLILPIK